ncbi:5-formyltetrahydrofolate cyclo-ligase [Roseateles asaccharophilus]|uniref:5-formyltetrahydrofolate cyclo-ligase n=1 Tax=Roseateles asaccharophilus TaxID=582607 RepID=A0ABU2A609_9BURK|nr:5-formyltetrahydrofolate cyclo-ligase [Roseateles asaccharophilus]MDR7332581.1 5,10-methenyltetrahydrofolate synthetase [Roseateles asaccharophilus]
MTATHPADRPDLRRQLLAARRDLAATPAFQAAEHALRQALADLLAQLEPELLGVYWPLPGEFDVGTLPYPRALPFARRDPAEMVFRRWDGAAPSAQDECGIATATGAVAVPDVVLVPCVGFTREGFRLGYGGGYFDRWLASHPGVTTVGVAWSGAETHFPVEAHDRALTLILTERELIAPD